MHLSIIFFKITHIYNAFVLSKKFAVTFNSLYLHIDLKFNLLPCEVKRIFLVSIGKTFNVKDIKSFQAL